MTIVSHEIDKISDSYKKLNYEKLIPCNCPVCRNSPTPHGYEFKKLIEKYSNGKLTVDCDKKPYHEVQILSLIDNAIDISQLKPDEKRKYEFNLAGSKIEQLIIQLGESNKFTGNVMKDSIHQNHSGNGDNVAGAIPSPI